MKGTSFYLKELIAGNLTTDAYNYLLKYTRNILKKHINNLPNHLELDDIITESITQAYLKRDQYDSTKAYEVTWYVTIVLNEAKQLYRRYNNKDGIKYIPNSNYIPNTITDDNNNTISIFDTLELVDEIDLDILLNDSKNTSELLQQFILENNLDVLYKRLYDIPESDGKYRQFNLYTMDELADIFGVSRDTINNILYRQKQKVINHFLKPNLKEKNLEEIKEIKKNNRQSYYEKNKEKLKAYQNEYHNKKKNKINEL